MFGNFSQMRWKLAVKKLQISAPMLHLGQRHLRRVIREYVAFYNQLRPQQGLDQQAPSLAEWAQWGGSRWTPRHSRRHCPQLPSRGRVTRISSMDGFSTIQAVQCDVEMCSAASFMTTIARPHDSKYGHGWFFFWGYRDLHGECLL